jgi:NADH-quinone oxidoreductase subunit E
VSATPSPFTPDEQKRFDAEAAKIFPKYPPERRSAALIPILHLAQNLHGWLKPEAMDYCASVVGVPATRVREVVTFYTMFHLKPVGRTHVQVCVNLSCWLRGSDKLVDKCREKLGTAPFQPTADGRLSWCEVECLASCGTAPAAMINQDYFEGLTLDELERQIAQAK